MRPLALQLERVFDLRQANRRSLRRASKFEEASTRYLAYPFPNQTSVRLNRPGSHAVLLLFQAANGLLRGSEKVGHALGGQHTSSLGPLLHPIRRAGLFAGS